jgi:hypothetical protein
MKYSLSRINPVKCAFVMAVLSLLVAAPMSIATYLGDLSQSNAGVPTEFNSAAFAIAAPLLYALFTFFFTCLTAWLYNVVAGRFGGIEIVLDGPVA